MLFYLSSKRCWSFFRSWIQHDIKHLFQTWKGEFDEETSKKGRVFSDFGGSWLTETENGFMEWWNLCTMRLGGDWTPQSSSENMTIDA